MLHTANRLKIGDSAFWGRVLGVIFAIVAVGLIGFGSMNWLTNGDFECGSIWATFLVGAMFLVGGLIVFVAAQTTTHDFDRQRGKLSIERQSFFRHRERREYDLANIADAILEENTHRDNEDDSTTVTYRAVYLLKSGEPVPWTQYFTGTRRDKETCVEAVREFLRKSI